MEIEIVKIDHTKDAEKIAMKSSDSSGGSANSKD